MNLQETITIEGIGVIKIEKLKGSHIMKTNTEMMFESDKSKYLMVLILNCVYLNNERITIKDLEELDASDYLQVVHIVGNMLDPLSKFL